MKVFGLEHILYLLISILLLTITTIILKKKIKDDKKIEIMFRIIGLIGLIVIILNRIAISIRDNNFILLIPDSYCGMTSLLTSIALLFFKKDNILLHGLWLIAIIGDLVSIIDPGFISKDHSIFYFPVITSFFHHTITLYAIILVFIFKYINLTINKAYIQLIMLLIYLSIGLIEIYGFKLHDAYYINEPILKNTFLTTWGMIPIYTLIYLIIMFIVGYFNRQNKKNESN